MGGARVAARTLIEYIMNRSVGVGGLDYQNYVHIA
jgi:hypothetical protein